MSEFLIGDSGAIAIILFSIPMTTVCFIAAWKIKANRFMYIGMGLGVLTIGLFYLAVFFDMPLSIIVPFSRVLWLYVLSASGTIAGNALITKAIFDNEG